MQIDLPKNLEQFVDNQVRAGRFSTPELVVTEALEQFKQTTMFVKPTLIDLFSDEPELMDGVVESAMRDCETRPLRLPADGQGSPGYRHALATHQREEREGYG